MGMSPSAKLGWGIDFGSEEDWSEGKYASLVERLGGESLNGWGDSALPALYIDVEARTARIQALWAAHNALPSGTRSREQYRAEWDAIDAEYPVPVSLASYSYEFQSSALVLKRSFTRAVDWGSAKVDPATLVPPTPEEMEHLKTAVEGLGLVFDPADVELILMSEYS